MGIDFSLCLVTRRDKSDSLLRHLSDLLDPESRQRICSLSWTPETEQQRRTAIGTLDVDARGIQGLQPDKDESPNSYCLSLQIQLEPEMEDLLGDHQFQCFGRPGSFGCMWTSVYAGSEYILLQMTAAASGMSCVIQQSETVHNLWTEFAQKMNAIFAYVDVEERQAIQLFPTRGELRLPDYETLSFAADYQISVDRMVEYLLATNVD